MAGEICKNHPGRIAVGHCETCHLPLCDKCAVTWPGTDKIFCTQQHAEQFMAYQERLGGKKLSGYKQPSMIVNAIKGLVGLAIGFAIAWAIAKFVFNVDLLAMVRGYLPF